jgi:maleamate amidohydrolase
MQKKESRTALVLVDVINSFYQEGFPNYYPKALETLKPISDLLGIARSRDALVIHSVERHHPGLVDFEFQKLPRHHERGAEDADFYSGFEPEERDREVVIPKRRYSGFFATDLDLTLKEQSVSRLLIVGVKTNVCIRATVQDAFAHGYDAIVPREATNSNRPHLEDAAIEDIERYFGQVIPVKDAEAML